ncbi:MAG: hypothetical protein PHW65_04145 [Dehalococcoidales bacterium]|nr:hypothetical protein [Dehalococcoidales bacterium]
MAKYEVERACGHTETVVLFGKTRDREWRLAREAEKLCYECWQKQLKEEREKENQEAAEAAKEMNLPELTGTEKQIAWAETIRQKMLADIDEFIFRNVNKEQRNAPKLREAIEHIKSKTEARWWIDNRKVEYRYEFAHLLENAAQEAESKYHEPAPEVVAESKAEATVRPEEPKTETVAEIRPLENAIEISFPEKREDFREIVKKQLKMRWNGNCWARELRAKNGTAADRASEAGHLLLAAGFTVRIYDIGIRQSAITGDYKQETTRWIGQFKKDLDKHAGWLCIEWDREREDFYNVARKLPGSRYDRPYVVVPPEQFEQVLDFAQMYDFKIMKVAQKAINAARKAKEEALIVKVDAPERNKTAKPSDKPPVLEVPAEVEVDETLRDDD